jgi:hypothetical protein
VIATTAPRVEQLRQRFYRAFARAHHAVLVPVLGRARAHNAQWRYYLAHTDGEIPVVLLQPSTANPGRAAP